MDFITILSISIGIIGLIATIIGSYLAYITYISPWTRFQDYLNKTKGWEKVTFEDDLEDIYRFKSQPGFQIVINWRRPVDKKLS
jgi:hypothetical protein